MIQIKKGRGTFGPTPRSHMVREKNGKIKAVSETPIVLRDERETEAEPLIEGLAEAILDVNR